jgi:hypothetical protein
MPSLFRPPRPNRRASAIADNPALAAAASSLFSEPGEYFSVVHGPRMLRPDSDNEVARRCNAMGRFEPRQVLMIGLNDAAERVITQSLATLPNASLTSVRTLEQLYALLGNTPRISDPLRCRVSEIGYGLLRALRDGKYLVVDDSAPTLDFRDLQRGKEHVIVLDDHDGISQVIAANFAYANDADLILIPERDDTLRDQIYMEVDARSNYRGQGRGEKAEKSLHELASLLRPTLDFGVRKLATFITRGIPYGYFYHDAVSTHLFSQPQLGETISAGIYWASSHSFICTAALIDPGFFADSETAFIRKVLEDEGVHTFPLLNQHANVEDTSMLIRAFPYDLLYVCTHCGEVPGHRLTVRLPDGDGNLHVVEIERALSIGSAKYTGESNKVQIHALVRPLSIDGTEWHSAPDDVKQHYTSLWKELTDGDQKNWEVLSETRIERVSQSTAIRVRGPSPQYPGFIMLTFLHNLDARTMPVVFNNSCVSFFEGAQTFTFAGSRAYVGTLAPVEDHSAKQLAESFFDSPMRAVSIPFALAEAQNAVFPDPADRTYVAVGCHFCRLQTPKIFARQFSEHRLSMTLADWKRVARQSQEPQKSRVMEFVRFLSQFGGGGQV